MDMNAEEIKKHFKDIFHQVAPEIAFDSIDMNLPLRDQVEIDSLDLYNIIVALQKKTGVYIPDSELADLANLNELINRVLEKNNKQGKSNELKS